MKNSPKSSRTMLIQALLFALALTPALASAAERKPPLSEKLTELLAQADFGHVAFCRPNPYIDELQVIGEPRWLREEEARKLAAVFSAESSWRDKDGRGVAVFCIPHYDFKIVLGKKDLGSVVMRFCTSCRVASATLNGEPVGIPTMLKPGTTSLHALFDEWFPDWQAISRRNYAEWAQRDRKTRPRDAKD